MTRPPYPTGERAKPGVSPKTEAEWLACADANGMLEFLQGKAGDRKLRLFALACCRRIRHLLHSSERRVVEVIDDYAENKGNNEARRAAFHETNGGPASPQTQAVNWLTRRDMTHLLDGSNAAMCVAALASQAVCTARYRSAAPDGPGRMVAAIELMDAEHRQQCGLVRRVFGNPFRAVTIDPGWLRWNGVSVWKLAQTAYESRDFSWMPILADALEEAGCEDADILTHCRQPGEHVRGCWVVDLLLGKS